MRSRYSFILYRDGLYVFVFHTFTMTRTPSSFTKFEYLVRRKQHSPPKNFIRDMDDMHEIGVKERDLSMH